MFPVEIAGYLAAEVSGLVLGQNLFQVPVPAVAPDLAVGMVELPGDDDEAGFDGASDEGRLERPRLRVVVRSGRDDASTGRVLAGRVLQALQRIGSAGTEVLAGTRYLDVQAEGPPFGPEYDANERPQWSVVVAATKEPST